MSWLDFTEPVTTTLLSHFDYKIHFMNIFSAINLFFLTFPPCTFPLKHSRLSVRGGQRWLMARQPSDSWPAHWKYCVTAGSHYIHQHKPHVPLSPSASPSAPGWIWISKRLLRRRVESLALYGVRLAGGWIILDALQWLLSFWIDIKVLGFICSLERTEQ